MRRHAKARSAGPTSSKAGRKLPLLAVLVLLASLALGVSLANAVAPTVTIEAPTEVEYTTAKVKGTVDPGDKFTEYHFEAATEADFSNVSVFAGFGSLSENAGQVPVEATLGEFGDMKPNTTYHVRLVASNEDGQDEAVAAGTITTKAVSTPTATIDPVSAITGTSAHFSGKVNPNAPLGSPSAFDIDWHFECTPECPGLPGPETIPADENDHTVQVDATGLEPNTNYEVRLVAKNAGEPVIDTISFTTAAVPPRVKTLPPAVITDTSAWIGGQIDPESSATTYYIEYSTDENFASSVVKVPASEDASAGSGTQYVMANAQVEGLTPGTTYHYRVVATGGGTTIGETEEVTTRTQPLPSTVGLPDGRVYEKVSPADKRGTDIFPAPPGERITETVSLAAPSGDAVAYSAPGNWDGDSAPVFAQYLARRQPGGGWVTEGLSPRLDSYPGLASNLFPFTWFSEDLSQSALATRAPLNPGDPGEDSTNVYLRSDNGTYTNLSAGAPPSSDGPPFGEFRRHILAVTPDGSSVVFANGAIANSRLLASYKGSLREVGVLPLPDGTPIDAQLGSSDESFSTPGKHALSDDGRRVYFHGGSSSGYWPHLYLRDLDALTTVAVSVSERPGDDPNQVRDAQFEAASSDGSVAIFRSNVKLTTDSNTEDDADNGITDPLVDRTADLYRWEAEAQPGERLTNLTTADPSGGRVLGTVAVSDDANTVYFVARGELAAGAEEGKPNLYLWKAGEPIRLVATLLTGSGISVQGSDGDVWSKITSGLSNASFREARMSPDGRYLAFSSSEALTAYDTQGTRQVYLYDSVDDTLGCLSCSALSDKSSADSYLNGSLFTEPPYHLNTLQLPHNLSDDGAQVVFDSAEALVPEDSNGRVDVYRWRNGSVDLISSGSSTAHSQLLDVSSGNDVFFVTKDRLTASDQDQLADLYDARVGGVPEPAVDPPCVADECQGTPGPPPNFITPASSSFSGSGNESPSAVRCRRGQRQVKVRGKVRCKPRAQKGQKAKKKKQANRAQQRSTRKDG